MTHIAGLPELPLGHSLADRHSLAGEDPLGGAAVDVTSLRSRDRSVPAIISPTLYRYQGATH